MSGLPRHILTPDGRHPLLAAVVPGVAILAALLVWYLARHQASADIVMAVLLFGVLASLGAAAMASAIRRLEVRLAGLANREALLHTVIDESPNLILVKDWDGRYLLANRALAALHGTTPEALVGNDDGAFDHGWQRNDADPAHIRSVLGTGKTQVVFEAVTDPANGQTRHFQSTMQPLLCGDGRPRLLVVANDITDFRRAQDRLEISEQRLAYALEAAGDGVWDWDLRVRRVRHNRHWCQMLGLDDQVQDHPEEDVIACIHPDDRAAVAAQIQHALAGDGFYRSEYRLARHNGSEVWIEDRGQVVEWAADGSPLRLVGSARDITTAKVAQARDKLFSDTMEASLLGIYIIQDLKFTYANPAFASLFGYTTQELMAGMGPGDLIAPEKRAEVLENLRRRAGGEPGKPYEVESMRRDGSTFEMLVWGKGVDYLGRPASVGTAVDISERKAMEAELRAHRDHLEDLVAERTSELVAARVNAERLARAKSDFLTNMSHEIRTPLNAVLGFARVGARGEGDGNGQRLFAQIVDAGQHLLGVINDILDFSKLDAGRLSIDQQPFPLGNAVANASSFVSGAAAEKGVVFRVEVAEDVPQWVAGDAQRLQQILANLLANAVKFTERGQVNLTVTRQGEQVSFQVRDTGVGISPELLNRLFRPFEQADTSTTRRFGGTGLGLAISRQLAQLMGGEITVDSAPGQGSTFTLNLPLPPATPIQPSPALAAAAGPRLAGLRVLAAEDSRVNQMVLEEMLVHEGAQVQFADDGRQALDRITQRGALAFDVVLMDVQMPVMDGYEATREIHSLAPDLPVLGLTAHALAEERENCLAAGMVEHITKPIDPDELVRAILRQAPPHWRAAASRAPVGTPTRLGAPPPPRPATLISSETGLLEWASFLERFNGNRSLAHKIITAARTGHADTPGQLRQAAEAGDWDGLAVLGHTLKGMTGHLAAQGLYDLSARLETAARGREPQAQALANRLADGLDDLLSVFAQWQEAGTDGSGCFMRDTG